MRQVIDGVIYDTDRATLVVSTTDMLYYDCSPWEVFRKVTLYLGNHGNWFSHIQGEIGIFRKKWDKGKLYPETPEEVYEFLARRVMVELLEKYFPEKVKNA